MPRTEPTIVTIVHGTRAQDASWMKEGSALHRILKASLGNDTKIELFCWSGKNSFNVRHAESEKLAEQLKKTVELHATALHIVVGHSHGGNIAAKALELSKLTERVHLACLSTPFLSIKPRIYTEMEAETIFMGICFTSAVLWTLFTKILIPNIFQDSLFFYVIPLIFAAASCFTWTHLKLTAVKYAELFNVSVHPSTSLLIVSATGDEAIASLGACQASSWSLIKGVQSLIRRIEELPKGTSRKRKVLNASLKSTGFTSCTFVGLGLITSGLTQSITVPSVISWAFTLLFVLIVIVSIVVILSAYIMYAIYTMLDLFMLLGGLLSMLLIAPFMFIVGMCGLGFGKDAIIFNLLYRITADVSPEGNWHIAQFVPESSSNMSHSSTYEDPKALSILSKWLVDIKHHNAFRKADEASLND